MKPIEIFRKLEKHVMIKHYLEKDEYDAIVAELGGEAEVEKSEAEAKPAAESATETATKKVIGKK